MCKRVSRWGLAVAAALVIGLSAAWAVEGQDEQVVAAFEKGVKYYQAGEYASAKEAFEQVLAANPGMPTALQLRDSAEIGVLLKMKENQQLTDEVSGIMDLMVRAQQERKRDIMDVDALMRDFQSTDMQVYAEARRMLIGHGPYAVPYLVPLLASAEAADPSKTTAAARAVAVLAAKEATPDVVLPLIEVLQGTSNSLLKQRVAGVMAQIGDPRTVAALLAVKADPKELGPTKAAALDALKMMPGMDLLALDSVTGEYAKLGCAYFKENTAVVGYTYGMDPNVWGWDAAAGDLAKSVTCEQVPEYLYYQRMASEVALAGLAVDPSCVELQALLGASQVRQYMLCEFFKGAETRFGGEAVAQEVKDDAAARAAEFEVEVPVVLSMLPASVVGRALEMTLDVEDGPASLCLVKALQAKLDAAGPGMPDAETVAALSAALDSGDKDVRYNAAVALVKACPTGEIEAGATVVNVLDAALMAAADRTAMVLVDDMQTRNKLVSVLRGQGLATSETSVDPGLVEAVLSLEPAVDIVFVSANVDERLFVAAIRMLTSDARTKAAPLFAVVDLDADAVDLGPYDAIDKVLTVDHLRAAVLEPIIKDTVLAVSRSASTGDEEAMVLAAASAMTAVSPLNTQYDLAALEGSLIKALTGYSEDVAMAAVSSLLSFGSDAAVAPLAGLVGGDGSSDLKCAACGGIAAILKRSEAAAPEDVVEALKAAVVGDVQELRVAAAEALSAAGLDAPARLALIRAEGLGEK